LTLLVVGAGSWIWLGQLTSLRGAPLATHRSELTSPVADAQDPLQPRDSRATRDADALDRSNVETQDCGSSLPAEDYAAADSPPVHPIAIKLLFWFGGAICVGIRR
jgi:hypothetical protein